MRDDQVLNRGGFTLLEVVVALAVGGVVLLGARMMMENLADGAERIVEEARAVDAGANADRLLRSLAGRVRSASVVPGAVSGDGRGVRFATWCDVPSGWQERCRAGLEIAQTDEGYRLLLSAPHTGRIVVRRGFESGRLLYLTNARDGGAWAEAWRNTLTTPHALGVVTDGDTSVVRIGARG